MITYGQGNLLRATADALVNTVNTEGSMGKGIALQFKKAFPANFSDYERACERGEVVIGKVLVHRTLLPVPRYVINFPTKKHWRQPSQLHYIRDGLVDLVAQVRALDIRSIAIPPLGCGLGGLQWDDVRPLIEDAFRELPEVHVVLYAPSTAPSAEAMPDRTARPRMTPGRAAVVGLIHQYLRAEYEDSVSLLEIQKLTYFLQVAGEPLKLEYAAHLYGPYADNLRQVLNRIEGHFTTGYGDNNLGPSGEIKLLPEAAQEATSFLVGADDTRGRMELVAELIEGFETPLGMELLATTHWVMVRNAGARDDVDATIAGVQRWNDRKARVMSPPQIRAAWERLRATPWAFTV